MTIHEISTDYAPTLQAIISLIGMLGIYFLWYQIKQNNLWNKANTQHSLMSTLPNENHVKRFDEIYRKYKDDNGVIPTESAKIIFESLDEYSCVKNYINKYEGICAAINAGAINEDYAYAVNSVAITKIFTWFENFVVFMRAEQGDDEIYIEIEKVATRWIERYESEKKTRSKLMEKMKRARGAKKIVT